MTDQQEFERDDAVAILASFKAGDLTLPQALALLSNVQWTSDSDPDALLLPKNHWSLIWSELRHHEDYEAIRAELIRLIAEKRQS